MNTQLHLDPIDDDDDDVHYTQTAAVSNFDAAFFHQIVQDSGRWAYGVVMVEVWVMNEDKTHLFRPVGGLWVDPLAHDYGSNDKFARILDPNHEGFFKALPFSPGIGLPGILWAEGREGNVAVNHPYAQSPFPNAVSPRHLPNLNRGAGGSNSRNGSGRAGRKNNRSLSRSGRFKHRHRRGEALQFDTLKKSGLYDEGNQDSPSPVVAGAEISAGKDYTSTSNKQSPADAQDSKAEKGHHHHHRRNTSDVEAGDLAVATSSGRILPGAAGGRVKNAIAKNLPFNTSQVIWRDVEAIVDDPDQPFNPRIKYLLDECGLGWAAGVPFHIGNTDGIVVYLARGATNVEKLMDRTNEDYLTHSSLVIGSAYALRIPRLAVEKERRIESNESFRKVRQKLHTICTSNRNLEKVVENEAMKDGDDDGRPEEMDESDDDWSESDNILSSVLVATIAFFRAKLMSTCKKSMGVQIQAPPATSWEQSSVTFVASFLTILVLTSVDESLVKAYGSNFRLVLGPFGAMSTLLYSLTPAPASQPRNAILGQTVSLFIAYGFGQTSMDRIWKHSLATATSIALMAKTGLTHPPAGASAMIFSSGSHTLGHVGIMLFGTVFAVLLATIFNNLDSKRQYPTSWGYLFGFCTDLFIEEYYDMESERRDPVIQSYANHDSANKVDHITAQDTLPGDNTLSETKTVARKRLSLAKLQRHASSFFETVQNESHYQNKNGNIDEVIVKAQVK